MSQKQSIVKDFWHYMHNVGLDDAKPDSQGFIQQLLSLFLPLLNLQPISIELKSCNACHFEESNRKRWPLPITIQDINHLNFSSLQEYFTWFMSPKTSQLCGECLKEEITITNQCKKEPNFIIIEFFSTNSKEFQYNQVLSYENTIYELVSTINMPYENHFNCCIFQPFEIPCDADHYQWYFHDGLKNNGALTPLNEVREIWKERPIILFYKKI